MNYQHLTFINALSEFKELKSQITEDFIMFGPVAHANLSDWNPDKLNRYTHSPFYTLKESADIIVQLSSFQNEGPGHERIVEAFQQMAVYTYAEAVDQKVGQLYKNFISDLDLVEMTETLRHRELSDEESELVKNIFDEFIRCREKECLS